jgi:hypothetical protein
MSNIHETYNFKNKRLEIHYDESADTPREWDNLAKMICFHNKYNLGDKHDYNSNDYNGWDEMKKAIIAKEDVAIIKPLYLYDHSGITIATTPFSCRWDSGQVGFVIVTKEAIRKEYSVKRVTKKVIEKATKVLDGEVSTYDDYLVGNVFGFILFEDDEETDTCFGFFGSDIKTNGILDYVDDAEFVEYLKK